MTIAGDQVELDRPPHAQVVKRPQDRVVLEPGRDDVIAGRHHPLDRQIERVGRVGREHDTVGIGRIEEVGELPPDPVHKTPGLHREVVTAASGRGSHLRVDLGHPVEYLTRFRERGRRVVEIDEPVRHGLRDLRLTCMSSGWEGRRGAGRRA